MRLELRHPTRWVLLDFFIIEAEDRLQRQDGERMVEGLRGLGMSREHLEESQYPPLTVRPGFEPVPRGEWSAALTKHHRVRAIFSRITQHGSCGAWRELRRQLQEENIE